MSNKGLENDGSDNGFYVGKVSNYGHENDGSDSGFDEENVCDCDDEYEEYGTDDDDDSEGDGPLSDNEAIGGNQPDLLEEVRIQFAKFLSTGGWHYINLVRMVKMAGEGSDVLHFAKSVAGDFMEIYNEEKAKRKLQLMNLDGQISLSVEILRCPECNVYMSLNAYFVDENWKLRKWTIRYQCVRSQAIQDFPTEIVMRVVSEWGFRNKISTFTYEPEWFDNELLDMIKDHVQEDRKLLGSKLFHLPCCAEVFKLMAEDAFQENKEVINKIEDLWCSGKSHHMWNCIYETIKDTFEAHTRDNYFADHAYDRYDKLSPKEWNQVEDLCQILQVLYGAAKVL